MQNVSSESHYKQVGKVVVQSFKDFLDHNAPQWAAAIAYYSLLSVFPLTLAAAALAAYFVDAEWAIQEGTNVLGSFLPGGASQIREIVEGAIDARGRVSLFSIIALGWSGSRVFGVVTKALNATYDAGGQYGFLKRVLIEVGMTLTIGFLFVLALGSRFLISFITNILSMPHLEGNMLWGFLKYVIRPVLLVVSVFLTYQYVPRRKVRWWAALTGAILFTILFIVVQPLFTGYIRSFVDYNLVYGPLAIVIVLVLWVWLVANILLLGGELVFHIQKIYVNQRLGEEDKKRSKHLDLTPFKGE